MDLRSGVVIAGRYEIATLLGEGAFGIVLRVRDRAGVSYALKLLTKEDDASRFAREVELVRALDHPNVVRLLDVGVHEKNPFVVFELVTGRTLAAEIAKGPIAPERLVVIAHQLLDALGAAHARGIIHRDIKPANVMIDGDRVKLLDFGVARSLDPARTALTGIGEVIGTPQYMSPEQVAAMPVDASTDLYSLGLVLAEALTGRPVYEGTLARVLARHASHEPAPIPATVLASPFGPMIARATQKAPPARFRSASAMLAALPVVPRSASVAAAQPQPTARGIGFFVVLATLAVLIVVASVGLGLWVQRRMVAQTSPPPIAADQPASPVAGTHPLTRDRVRARLVELNFRVIKEATQADDEFSIVASRPGQPVITVSVYSYDSERTSALAQAAFRTTNVAMAWCRSADFMIIQVQDPKALRPTYDALSTL